LAHGSSACRGASARLGGDRRRARSVVRRTAQARWRTVLPISGLPSRIAGSDAAHGDGAGHGCRRMREVRQHGFDREQPQSSSNMAARASDARSHGNVIPPFQRIAARSRRSGTLSSDQDDEIERVVQRESSQLARSPLRLLSGEGRRVGSQAAALASVRLSSHQLDTASRAAEVPTRARRRPWCFG
jgi:hypothetical protein